MLRDSEMLFSYFGCVLHFAWIIYGIYDIQMKLFDNMSIMVIIGFSVIFYAQYFFPYQPLCEYFMLVNCVCFLSAFVCFFDAFD